MTYSLARLGWGDLSWEDQEQGTSQSPSHSVTSSPPSSPSPLPPDVLTEGPMPPRVHRLLAEAASALSRCSSQDLANLTWGIAQMGIRPPQGWCHHLADVLARRSGAELQGGHLAIAVWALGKMEYKPKPRSLIQARVIMRVRVLWFAMPEAMQWFSVAEVVIIEVVCSNASSKPYASPHLCRSRGLCTGGCRLSSPAS